MTVYFIGAGPGDPELITVKGQRLINASPVVIYAGSLVPRAVMADTIARPEFIIDSAKLHLDQIIEHIKQAMIAAKMSHGCIVAILHYMVLSASKCAA